MKNEDFFKSCSITKMNMFYLSRHFLTEVKIDKAMGKVLTQNNALHSFLSFFLLHFAYFAFLLYDCYNDAKSLDNRPKILSSLISCLLPFASRVFGLKVM